MKHKNISEGVLDVTDEEGWMAKSQLYKIAKYAGELHSMIGDTDQLEPWMQAKITKAADYMGAVKHYMEYSMVSNVAQAVVPMAEPEAVPMDVEPEAVPMESVKEEEVNEGKPKDWKKAKGRGRHPRRIDLTMSQEKDEENAIEEDAEFKSIANEFIGNALLRILDEEEVDESQWTNGSKKKKKCK